jgi:2-hydroxychromene-2-carboxylate isomerase
LGQPRSKQRKRFFSFTSRASSGSDYLDWAKGEGAARLEACVAEGHEDHVFGVPLFLLDGEPFWGHDRIPLLEERLTERGLRR